MKELHEGKGKHSLNGKMKAEQELAQRHVPRSPQPGNTVLSFLGGRGERDVMPVSDKICVARYKSKPGVPGKFSFP